MTILSKEVFPNQGPHIEFADCPHWLSNDEYRHAGRAFFKDCVFFEMSDHLLGSYCSVTNTDSPIDPCGFVQTSQPYEIRKIASELLLWSHQLSRMGTREFTREVVDRAFYEDSRRVRYGSDLTGEHLRLDMIETLLMLVDRLLKIAQKEHCLIIAGI
jgi:hypothetical protein